MTFENRHGRGDIDDETMMQKLKQKKEPFVEP
jgi:hypothetical protein